MNLGGICDIILSRIFENFIRKIRSGFFRKLKENDIFVGGKMLSKLEMMTGLLPIDTGKVIVNGKILGKAQAIMEHQKIIILDEPYNALDFNTNKEITKILNELKEEGRTILLTSHQHEYLEKLCDTMYYIENGELELFDEKRKAEYFAV